MEPELLKEKVRYKRINFGYSEQIFYGPLGVHYNRSRLYVLNRPWN